VAQALLGYYGEQSPTVAAQLALLWEAARDFGRAADCFLLAAQNATRLFANQEAILLAQRGLELLKTLPDTPERAQRELALQITLGPLLIATMDWTAPEIERTYARAHALCRQVGETPQLFPVLWGLWATHVNRSEHQTARSLGEQLLGIAQSAHDPALLLQAQHALGLTYAYTGDWVSAQAHLEQGIALYDPKQHRGHTFLYGGHDPGVCCRCYATWCLWVRGYPDQALRSSHEALTLARQLSHPTSLAHARLHIGQFHQFRRDGSETLAVAEALQGLATEQGLHFYLSGGALLRGWALAERGHAEEGLAQINQAGTAPTSARFWRIYFLALLAEAYGKGGKTAEGLAALTEALSAVKDTGVHFYEPEMHRLKGELLLAGPSGNPADAEACFLQAIGLARSMSAKSWELRSVLSLGRLYHRQGRQKEARPMLAEIYNWFTEGFDTVDLREAKALLQAVS
jgi:predicted ATPase